MYVKSSGVDLGVYCWGECSSVVGRVGSGAAEQYWCVVFLGWFVWYGGEIYFICAVR